MLTARKIILASGGCGASAELLFKNIPKAVGIPFPGHHGSTGDGLAVGVSGKELEGSLPGNGVLASLGLGRIAAEHGVASLSVN